MSLKSVASLDDTVITPFQLGYLKAAARDKAYATVLNVLLREAATDPRVTRAFIARRLDKDAAQITRYLGSPGNWTIDTYALLLAAMGYEPRFGADRLCDARWDNQHHDLAGNSVSVKLSVADNRQKTETGPSLGTPVRKRLLQTNLTMSPVTVF